MPGFEKREACAVGTKSSPLYSQSLIVGEMVYLSGITGVDWATGELVGGTVGDRTVSSGLHSVIMIRVRLTLLQRQVLRNASRVLEASGSDMRKVVRGPLNFLAAIILSGHSGR
jgi:enamine deaminase RidA (YjgF/YER057c/UK114 family)